MSQNLFKLPDLGEGLQEVEIISWHVAEGDFVVNERHQRRCYEIVFQSIQNKPWCNGILWWKYPSDLEHRSRRSTGFTPHGKLAEATVEKWFIQKGE